MALTLNCLHGADIQDYLSELAQLRIEVFREYPYLYVGDHAYEMDYLKTYSQSPESVFVIASAGDKIVGISTGLPMNEAHSEFREPFVAQHYDPQAIFYFGESILLPAFRGQGAYTHYFCATRALRTVSRTLSFCYLLCRRTTCRSPRSSH